MQDQLQENRSAPLILETVRKEVFAVAGGGQGAAVRIEAVEQMIHMKHPQDSQV